MQPISEAFLESSWEDAPTACEARDLRAAQLDAVGYDCDCLNLWNVEGYRVYVVTAEPAPSTHSQSNSSERPYRNRLGGSSSSNRPVRRTGSRA
jgi:hypothetical protein